MLNIAILLLVGTSAASAADSTAPEVVSASTSSIVPTPAPLPNPLESKNRMQDAVESHNPFGVAPHRPNYLLPYTYNTNPNQGPTKANKTARPPKRLRPSSKSASGFLYGRTFLAMISPFMRPIPSFLSGRRIILGTLRHSGKITTSRRRCWRSIRTSTFSASRIRPLFSAPTTSRTAWAMAASRAAGTGWTRNST